eukprot:TRINITY_DN66416_c0_g1_i1.p2 TRINITY_DN66416_c0_g1~~TRINITY_DN66416_c0_g1_i1.p2  ORF type:complete len:308 (+),score=49.59 TRINITY_DN66416_c0_g1_i1:155-1078(+)
MVSALLFALAGATSMALLADAREGGLGISFATQRSRAPSALEGEGGLSSRFAKGSARIPEVMERVEGLGASLARESLGLGISFAKETSRVLEPKRPVFESRFHVTFDEVTHGLNPFAPDITNAGSFHYDIVNGRQVWSHGKGQVDNWCECAGLSSDEPCDLVATKDGPDPDGATYIVYRTLGKCCKLGDYAHGFGPLRPDWLVKTNASFRGEITVGGRTCYSWAAGPPGDWFMMNDDLWTVDADGLPCVYEDDFKSIPRMLGMKHILTFDRTSYSTSTNDESAYKTPDNLDCSAMCPNKAGSWCLAR